MLHCSKAAYADEWLGKVLDELDRLGLAERTLVIVVGDHGEIFDPEHDHFVQALGQPTLHHHGWSAYDEILRVPLIVAQPGAIRPTTVAAQVRLYDLAATIADYLGLGRVGLPSHGRSLRPLIEGADHDGRAAYVEGQNVRALRGWGMLYLRRDDPRLTAAGRPLTVAEELYDLAADPAQHDNLAARDFERMARARRLFAGCAPPRLESRYHLALAADSRPHHLEGTFAVGEQARVDTRRVTNAATSVDARTIRISLDGPGFIDLGVEPPEAPLTLNLTLDGAPLDPTHLLAGEFALPLVDAPLQGDLLRRFDAPNPPLSGDRGGVLLYRDAARRGKELPAAAAQANDEVTGMMQRWGYAQPAK
jgi:Sulfatase